MTATVIERPEQEPVSLIDMKTYLRVCDDGDDDLIASLITAARVAIETATGRLMMRQTWRLVLDRWPQGRILRVPIGPLLGLAAARVADAGGSLQAVPPGYFVVDVLSGAGRIALGPDVPAPGLSTAGIELDLVVGYGTDPERVPMPMRQALRQLVAGWYEHRGDTAVPATLPAEVAALLAPYRPMRL
ncbi:MAG: head-tail connector protein [Chelatococcus sp.]|uniref:head-tail connector protein n=1 Tax=Chelatococcus sp. TaxID=1953771 RepID=UPI0025BBC95C|nr:head-tail connector protein [Chelatococcus sp.]MBX3537382.1 head-tail connector protein [Chelatococcus sp.]